jgi:hypothetical protein
MRTLAVTTLIIGTLAALPAAEPTRPLSPTAMSFSPSDKGQTVLGAVAADLAKQSGVPITVSPAVLKAKCDVQFTKVPFWEALQTAADKSGARITLHEGGRKVELVPRGKSREVAATSGSFRVVAQQVTGRALLDQGVTVHEVSLLVHWEPRMRVYRIDSVPNVSKVTDVPGSKLSAEVGGAQVLPLDSTSEMRVKINGLTRDSEKITTLAGVFTATGAEKLLAFSFEAPGGKLPALQKDPTGVTASLKRVQKKDDTWEVAVEVNYPPGQPVFESFQGEWWLRDNRLTVRSPEGKSFVIDDFEIPMPDSPQPLKAVYRFKEDAAKGLGNPTKQGWSIIYETPSPLVEVKIPFELKDIPLP